MYGEGDHCAWRAPSRSTAPASGSRLRSRSSWRASRARFSSRSVRTRSATLSIGELGPEADHHRDAQRHRLVPERRSRVAAALAEDLVDEVGRAVQNLRDVAEVRRTTDVALEPEHL